MIDVLIQCGEIAQGKQALWALLEVVTERVGIDQQQRIEALRPAIMALSQSTAGYRSHDSAHSSQDIAQEDQTAAHGGVLDTGSPRRTRQSSYYQSVCPKCGTLPARSRLCPDGPVRDRR